MEWFYANKGDRMGPVSPVIFEGLVRDRIVDANTMVWTGSMAEWQTYGQVEPTTAVCAASGGRYLQRDMVPYEGKFISADNKEQYFQRLREGVVLPGRMIYAGFWIRFVAKFIDWLVGMMIGIILNIGLGFVFFGHFIVLARPPQGGGEWGRFIAFQACAYLIGLAFGVSYQWFFLTRYGATPGKMALGLKVVRGDGSAITGGRAVGRYFAELLSAMIFLIGYIMAGFDEEKRALHDRICDTRVIKSR